MTEFSLSTNEDVVDRNVNEFDEIADQTHHDEANSGSGSSLGEL